MESRTRLAIGGMATVAASVTVICVVALTNSLALSDSAGSPIDAAPVVVPASGASGEEGSASDPTPTPTPVPAPEPLEPVAETPSDPVTSPPSAEVVPAPDAQVVTPTHPSPVVQQPTRPAVPSVPSSQDDAIAQAQASGSWAPVRAWAQRQGWSDGRIDAFIAKLERARDSLELDADRGSGSSSDQGNKGNLGNGQSVQGGSDTGRVQAPSTGSNKTTQGAASGSTKERPADAGASVDNRSERPGLGAKKDRSRDSPERRDR